MASRRRVKKNRKANACYFYTLVPDVDTSFSLYTVPKYPQKLESGSRMSLKAMCYRLGPQGGAIGRREVLSHCRGALAGVELESSVFLVWAKKQVALPSFCPDVHKPPSN